MIFLMYSRLHGGAVMAKPVTFGRPAKPKGGSTSFNFGANKVKGGSKKSGNRGGSGGGS